MQEVDSDEISKAWVMMLYHDLDKNKRNPLPHYEHFLQKVCVHDEQIHKTLFLMMAEIRDRHQGKGQCLPFFYLAKEWAQLNPEKTVDAFVWICKHVGCWKDVKRWAHHIQDNSVALLLLVQKTNDVLSLDTLISPEKRSNVAKWIPREHTHDGKNLYDLLAIDWCRRTPQNYWLQHLNEACLRKIRKQYRQLLSQMHKEYVSNTEMCKKKHVTYKTWNLCISNLIQQQGIPLENTEQELKEKLQVCNLGSRNMVILWIPSHDDEALGRQMAVLLQAWNTTQSTPKMLMVQKGTTKWVDVKTHPLATYAEWVHLLSSWKANEAFDGWDTLLETIPLPENPSLAEKMTWLWVADMNELKKSIQYTLLQRQTILPHMVYVDTACHSYHDISTHVTFPCRVVQPRCSMVAATSEGLTKSQWEQIILRTQSLVARQSSSWDLLEGVIQPYMSLMKLFTL